MDCLSSVLRSVCLVRGPIPKRLLRRSSQAVPGPLASALTMSLPAMPPPRRPLVCPAQAMPGDYRIGDVVFSLRSFSDKYGSIEPGARGTVVGPCTSGTDPDKKLNAKFEGYGNKINIRLREVSRDPDPNNVGDDYCAALPP